MAGPDYSPTDFNAVVQTVAGEGANQPPEGQRAIASTVLNRHAIQGGSIADIASDPGIYNAAKSKNAKQATPGSPLYDTIAANVAPVFTDGPTTKATHYYNPELQAQLGRKAPGWAAGQSEKVGDHLFYDRSDLLSGGSKTPTADELETHFSGKAPGKAPAVAPSGPTADDLERHFGGPAKPPARQTPQQQAAARDASSLESVLTMAGSRLFNSDPHMGGTSRQAPDMVTPFLHGVTQGFGDELKGKLFAGVTGAKNLALNALGQPIPYGMKDAEAAETQAARTTLAAQSKAHPIATTVAATAGTVLPWLAGGEAVGAGRAAVQAPTALGRVMQLGGRVAQGAVKGGAVGGAGGAVNAFGNSTGNASARLPAAMQGAETGGALGAVLGAGAPVVAPVASKVVNALGHEVSAGTGAVKTGITNAVGRVGGRPVETTAKDYFAANSPTARKVAGLMTPVDAAEHVAPTPAETQAAQSRVMQMMGAKGMHTDDLRAVATDIPHTTAEAIGSQTVNHLASLARRSGVTPDAAGTQIAQRAQEFGSSILDDFGKGTGIQPEEAHGGIDALVGRLKGQADPLWAAVRSHQGPVWNADLAQIAQRPVVAKAIDAAASDLRNAGKDPLAAGFKLNPDSGLYELNGNTLEKTAEHQPTAETWENVRQRIGDQVDKHPLTHKIIPDSESRGNFNINAAKRDLTNVLAGDAKGNGALIPGYRNALDASGEQLSAQSAFSRGHTTLLTDKVTPRDFEKTFNGLTPAEQQAWRAGVAGKLYDQSQTRTGLTPSMLKAPSFQAKIRTVMGDHADEFLDRLTQRVRLQATGNRIMPGAGSQTTPLLQATEETNPVDALGNFVKEAVHAKANPGGFLLKHAVNHSLGDKAANVAETPGYRNAYGRLLLQHPRETADELRAAGREAPKLVSRSRIPVGATAGYVGGQAARQ